MKPAHFLGMTLMLAPLGVSAQTVVSLPQSSGTASMEQTRSGGQTTALTAMARNPCAVALQAKHLADGDMVKTRAAQPKGPGQRLHLSLTSPDSRTIATATVNVRGWDHAGVATTSAQSPALAMRTITVRFSGGQDHAASADIWVPGLNSVTVIDLLAISFTNGSGWSPAPGHCRIAPDPFMLVSQ